MEIKTKKCFKCGKVKGLTEFYKHPEMLDGTVNKCKECNKKDVRENYNDNRESKHEYDRYRQRYSISRMLNHRYSTLKRRCEKGGSNGRRFFVTGTKYLSKDEFAKWFYDEKNYKIFSRLYDKWVQSGFEHKLAPSIDRINSKKSYVAGNIQWLTLSENCKKYNN